MTTKKPLQTVHALISNEPSKQIVSEEVKLKHIRSKQSFPDLNLSEHEYVLAVFKRHPIGLFLPTIISSILIFLTFLVIINFKPDNGLYNPAAILSFGVLFIILIILVTYIYYHVYNSNKLFLTNEMVIQRIQLGLFSMSEQSISLADVEDANYTQSGLFQHIFNYGSIKLSTIGDEHTYSFIYASNPKKKIDDLNSAVEAFKNGRPVRLG